MPRLKPILLALSACLVTASPAAAQTLPSYPLGRLVPHELDPRAADPAAPNPLVGTKWFVDRMEPAYAQWARWRRAGETGKSDTIWRLAREPRFRWFGR